MKKLTIQDTRNLNLRIFLTLCSLLMGFSLAACADSAFSQVGTNILSQIEDSQAEEIDAYLSSKYNYCDALLLAYFWDASVLETKARIGRKIIWEDGGIPYLEQYLVDARSAAIQEASPQCGYTDGGHNPGEAYNYDDAVALAEFWGDPSPWEAKERIVRNLMLGNQEEIESALAKVNR